MKKLIIGIGIALIVCGFTIRGCSNHNMFDTNYTYDTALVKWPTMKRIAIKQWAYYEGEQIQIIGKDGKIYLISMNNAVLIRN